MTWPRVRGHERVAAQFDNARKKGRLGHAYLFVGPDGVGKFTFAKELAKALLCEQPSDVLAACDHCAGCSLIAAGTHPDLFFAAKPDNKNELPLEVIKDLMAQLSLKTARGKGKIAILADAADMNTESANAFLKYLEEPPVGSLLILIGGPSSEGFLPTILSRCQLVRFAPLAAPLLRELLAVRGITNPETVERLVRMSNGSLGQALALNEEALWNFRVKLLSALRGEKINAVDFAKDWIEFVEEAGKESAAKRGRTARVLQLLLGLLQDAQRVANGVTPLVADTGEAKVLGQLAQRLGPEKLLDWIDRMMDTASQNERYVSIDLLIEACSDYLAR